MTRRATVAVALLCSLLAMSAAPVAAANTAVGSINTTNADFNNAASLDGVEVANNNVSANFIIDSFEDGNLAEYSGNTSAFSFVSTASDGSRAIKFTGGSTATMHSTGGLTRYPDRGENFTADVNLSTGDNVVLLWGADANTSEDSYGLLVSDNGLDLNKYTNGAATTLDSNNSNLPIGQYLTAEVEFDSTITAVVRDKNGQEVAMVSAADPDYSGGSVGIKGVEKFGGGETKVDNIRFPEGATSEYIGANHSVADVSSGFSDLELSNAEATVTWQAYTGASWTDVSSATYTTSGNKTQSLSGPYDKWRVNVTFEKTGSDPTAKLEDEGVLFSNDGPTFNNSTASPSGGTEIASATTALEINVSDPQLGDPQGDELTVRFYAKSPTDTSFAQVGTDTLTSNGTASVTSTFSEGGSWHWFAEADDDYGGATARTDADANTAGNQNFSFETPDKVTIREEAPPHDLVTGSDATIKFFELSDGDPVIVNRSDTNGDGKISLNGLPVDEQIAFRVNGPNHEPRTVVLDGLYSQETIFLLNNSATPPPVQIRFRLTDQTGGFGSSDTQIIVQRAINESIYNTTGGFDFRRVVGGDVGAQSGYTTSLQEDERYRILVRADNGDVRQLGSFQPEAAETVNLEINKVVDVNKTANSTALNVSRVNSSVGGQSIVVEYNDSARLTSSIFVKIYERNNETNTLVANTSFTSGPYGTFSLSQNIPASQNNTDFVVRFVAVRDDAENVQATIPLSDQQDLIPAFPGWLAGVGSIGLLWITAGLFSQVNGRIGGLVVAGEGALLWFFGFVPDGLGVGVVVLALVTAGLMYVNDPNDGGL